ncbi:hypothetical protein K432DRAFT_376974 [Lepidopterella palustris CBS 459.81]|uniref:Ubiquitin 3 binding protein But2 C-terminal domain-containing protein n=1 Tax=Lepidopterella palustris CBS 459.81 TaxID=1314670 RepID=A0A8E2ELF7_9PEZI|nr:hypothetical protein K432DRAFT_376974 [Lepidopterella palustris CBS 459.81]
MKFTLASLAAIIASTSAVPTPSPMIRPDSLSLYTVSTGAIDYNSPTGRIFKNGHDSDVTTLLTFTFPDNTAGKTCQFNFALNDCLHCNPSPPTGTAQFDVYTSQAPADHSTTGWPSGNLRDEYVGRLQAIKPGVATYVPGFPVVGQGFPCPAGMTFGGELVGAGDNLDIQWDGKGEGPYFSVY